MKESTLLIAFILLIIGTIGLLINELIFDWGRCVACRETVRQLLAKYSHTQEML